MRFRPAIFAGRGDSKGVAPWRGFVSCLFLGIETYNRAFGQAQKIGMRTDSETKTGNFAWIGWLFCNYRMMACGWVWLKFGVIWCDFFVIYFGVEMW